MSMRTSSESGKYRMQECVEDSVNDDYKLFALASRAVEDHLNGRVVSRWLL